MRRKPLIKITLCGILVLLCIFAVSCNGKDCKEHSFGEWKTETSVTCEAEGKQTRTCGNCGDTEEQSVPALGHSYTSYVSDGNATCVDGTKTAVCENGCGKTDTQIDVGSGSGIHSLVYHKTTQACCEASADNISKCEHCEYTESISIAPATGHLIDSYNIISQTPVEGSECTYQLVIAGSCSECRNANVTATKTVVIHEYVSYVTEEATCKSEGTKYYKCKNCTKPSHTEEYTDPSAHVWAENGLPVNGVQNFICTENSCGVTKRVFKVAGKTYTGQASALSGAELKLGDVLLELDSNAIGFFGNQNITVSSSALDVPDRANTVGKLSEAHRAILGVRPIYELTLMSEGEPVSDIGNGKLKITVPYLLSNDEDPGRIVILCITGDGKVRFVPASYSSGKVTFEADNASLFAAVNTDAVSACAINGHSFALTESKALPTCESIGYTVTVCTRCGFSGIGEIIPALGHGYGAPVKAEPGCTVSGSYTYKCNNEGCGHSLELPVPAAHKWSEKEKALPNCVRNGYTVYYCDGCGDTKTVIIPITDEHDLYTEHALIKGADDCAGGVAVTNKCKNEGCPYSEYLYTVFEHIASDGESSQNTVTLDISRDMIALKQKYPDTLKVIATLTKSDCVCGKQIRELSFSDEGEHFSGLSYYWVQSSDIPSVNDCTDFSHNGEYTVRIVRRTETVNCIGYFYVDILVGYNALKDTAEVKHTVLITTFAAHNEELGLSLKEGAENCADGVILTYSCKECGIVTGVSDSPKLDNGHFYLYGQDFYSMSEYSMRSHKARIEYGICACGTSKYRISYPEGTVSYEKCDFEVTESVVEQNKKVTTYVCNCGIAYRETVTNTVIDDCTVRRYQTVEYGKYGEESDSFDRTVISDAYVDIINHSYKGHRKYTYVCGCYQEYTVTLRCDCGAVYPDHEDKIKTYAHQTVIVTERDHMNYYTVTVTCASCGYIMKYTEDENENVLSFYSEEIAPDGEGKTVTRKSFRYVSGGTEEVFSTVEIFDASGAIVSFEQRICFFITDSLTNVYTVYSDGSVKLEFI